MREAVCLVLFFTLPILSGNTFFFFLSTLESIERKFKFYNQHVFFLLNYLFRVLFPLPLPFEQSLKHISFHTSFLVLTAPYPDPHPQKMVSEHKF